MTYTLIWILSQILHQVIGKYHHLIVKLDQVIEKLHQENLFLHQVIKKLHQKK